MADLRALLAVSQIDVSTLRILDGAVRLGLLTTSGDRAIPLWRDLRAIVAATGHWPVVLGPDDALEAIERQIGEVTSAGLEPRKIDISKIREARAREIAEERSEIPLPLRVFLAVPTRARDLLARLRPTPRMREEDYSIPLDILTLRPHARVHLGLVPIASHWAVPELLGFGGWNECPDSAVHTAILHDWSDRFGAEIVGLSNDTLEMRVARPPRTRSAARALAREQYLYCRDIVDQGVRSIETLALSLVRAPSWYFWWD